jgi:L-asparaginase II
MAQTSVRAVPRSTARGSSIRSSRLPRYPRGAAPPVLVEVRRGDIVESRHRGHAVQVSLDGRIEHGIGDPQVVVSLRSTVKPFALAALIESGAADELRLSNEELAVMAASHTGEDAHVRTIQGVLRRAALSQSMIACPTDGAPLDTLTAARLAREGERPSAIRHNCSGFHVASLLLARHAGWTMADYWRPDHRSQLAVRDVVARVFGARPTNLLTATDACGVLTYGFPLVDVARGYALLADPAGAADTAQRPLIDALTRVRDAMLAAPQMVGGSRDSLDTRLMLARPGRLIVKGGAEGLRGFSLLAGARGDGSAPAGIALTIEDGDLSGRAGRSAGIELLAQLGVFKAADLERLGDAHRPTLRDPRGAPIGEIVPVFELAPIAELIGGR